MSKNQSLDIDFPSRSRQASAAVLDPTRRLVMGVVIRAAKECRDPNLLDALDALLFILDDRGAPMWLDAVGWPYGPDVVFGRLLDGKATRKFSKLAAE